MSTDWKTAKSIFDFTVKDIEGQPASLDKYRGMVTLILNGACKCGFTDSNYRELEEMNKELHDRGFRVLVFPSNQFAGEEPWPESEIMKFLQDKYDAHFEVFGKINVNGDSADPLFKYLKMKQGGTLVDAIKWNFTKFVCDKEGQPIKRYSPNSSPKTDCKPDILRLLEQ